MRAKLLERAANVGANGTVFDPQVGRDLAVVEAARQQPQYFLLARSQPARGLCRLSRPILYLPSRLQQPRIKPVSECNRSGSRR